MNKLQTETIERISQNPQVKYLYKETSMSGKSETLRYFRQWAERGRWGNVLRTQTGMVLSVTIHCIEDGKDDPKDIEKYNSLCDEAINLFAKLREGSVS